CQQHDSSPYTF
nr:immunoglobulin light chain junction region [Macaca mulatta]MOX27355.1 immunoglobulin light chain junction region [Macaca mulatta]